MRVVFLAMAGLVAVASAQVSALPQCAQACVTKFTTGDSIGGCPALKAACICASPSFLSDIACCLASACNASDQQQATTFAQNFCKISGVTNLPSAVVCSSTTTGSSTSAPASGSSTSSSGSSTTSSGPSTTSGASSGASSANAASTPSKSGTSSSATASATGNAGIQNMAGVGAGIFGGLAVFAAIL